MELAIGFLCIFVILLVSIILFCCFLYKKYINKNSKNNQKFNNINIYKPVRNKHAIFSTKTQVKEINTINKRNLSTSSKRTLNTTILSCISQSEEVTSFIKDKNISPCFIYEDLVIADIKTRILNDTLGLSGIYLILNKTTSDYYIGSAATGKINARFSNHLFNFNGSKVLKNAVKKYGISSFAFMILELFPDIVNKENNKRLLDLEDFYLKSLLPNYNILTEAGSSFGYKHTEITRIKMKAEYSEERRIAIGNLNKGKSLSYKTKELIRQAALNRTKPIYSSEAVKNMKKKSKAVIVYNFDYTIYGEFNSIIDTAKSLGCDQKTVRRALQTPKKILKRR